MKKFSKITQKQIAERGVQALSDRPNVVQQYGQSGLSATQLKLWFDKLATFLAERINLIQEAFSGSDAASYFRLELKGLDSEKEKQKDFLYSLQDLCDSFKDGNFAKYLLAEPSESDREMRSVQEIFFETAKTIEEIKSKMPIPGSGLTIAEDGKTINHKNAVEAGTASGTNGPVLFGDTIKIPKITYDDTGHVTKAGFTEVTLPKAPSPETPVPHVTKEDVGLGNVDNVRQYSAENPPPYPVESVNEKTGKITIDATELMTPLQEETALSNDDTLAFLDKGEGVAKSVKVGTLKLLFGGSGGDAGKYGGLISTIGDGKINIIAKPGTEIDAATVKRLGTGAIMVKSLDDNVVTADLEGDKVKVTVMGGGEATIAISVASDDTFTPASMALHVFVLPYDPKLSKNDWASIGKASDEEVASAIWSVGDTKDCHVQGTIGTLAVDATLWTYIIGFNNNEIFAGGQKTYFGMFKNAEVGGVDVCLVDSNYGRAYTGGTKFFNMNHSEDTNVGGWKSCDLRYDILGSTHAKGADANATTTASPVENTLMASLEKELRDVMKPIIVYTDNVGGERELATNVSATVDYLPLLSEFEIFGTRICANSTEQNYQQQFAYYANGNDRKKFKHNKPEESTKWWSRSPNFIIPSNSSTSIHEFSSVADGVAAHTSLSLSCGIAAYFAV